MSEFLISTRPFPELCARCKGWILECQVFGFRTELEPIPLNPVDEVKMRMQGRRIFQTMGTVEPFLVRRTLWHIAKSDPHTKVLATNDCKTPTYFEPAPLFEKTDTANTEGVPF